MVSMAIDIQRARDAPSKMGEFYPATGSMADGRELQWVQGKEVIAIIIRDLVTYKGDFVEITSGILSPELDNLEIELNEMIDFYKKFFSSFMSREITPDDILNITIRPPMNPLEELVGMMTRVYIWLDFGDYHDAAVKSNEYARRIDKINDRLWTIVDNLERGRESS